jgi:hypothetical protein
VDYVASGWPWPVVMRLPSATRCQHRVSQDTLRPGYALGERDQSRQSSSDGVAKRVEGIVAKWRSKDWRRKLLTHGSK